MKRATLIGQVVGPLLLINGCGPHVNTPTTQITNQTNSVRMQAKTASNSTVLNLKRLAQNGKVDNTAFVSGKTYIRDVEKEWGRPDSNNAVGDGTYASYNSKHAAFGYNRSGIIFDVRSYSHSVQQLTAGDVTKTLGKPASVNSFSNQVNDIYQVNDTYQLQFIVNTTTNKVDHISVFDQHAVQTLPTGSTGSTPIRGIIEGFYGTPWTYQERVSMYHFMKNEHLNTYVYAPKGDPYQRALWGDPYPAAQLSQMKLLAQNAESNSVNFVYSISPGIPAPLPGQKLTSQMIDQSITYSSAVDRAKLEDKINQMESIGVHTFILSFDDIETTLKPADQKVYGNQYAKAQMQLANQILHDERMRDPQFKLWLAPTSYYGLVDGPYWQTMRTMLNPSVQVIWTGKWVINKTITTPQAEAITNLYGRKPIIWDNFPVNDYTYDVNQSHQLMMGPLQGRDSTLLSHIGGYVSNPMLQPDASQLALQTIADYLHNPSAYQPLNAWNQAIEQMPGISNPAMFKTFALYTSASELNPGGYDPSGSMIASYWNARTATQRRSAEQALRAEFQTLASLPSKLPPTITDKELMQEIQPWLTKLGDEGQGGLDALNEIGHPSSTNQQVLKQQLSKVTGSDYQIGSSIIAFMKKTLANS